MDTLVAILPFFSCAGWGDLPTLLYTVPSPMTCLASAPWDMERELAMQRQHMRQLSISCSNALDNFSYFKTMAKSKKLVVLLDYDGTLTPIVNDPSQVKPKAQIMLGPCHAGCSPVQIF